VYNAYRAGDWKRQSYYKPTPEELARIVLYKWLPAPGFREIISRDVSTISLDGRFDDFEIPTLLMEAQWDLTWGTDKADLMRKNHPHAQFAYFEKSGHRIFADEPEKFFTTLKNFLEQASKEQITYKPGNRLAWPKPLSPLAAQLVMTGSIGDKAAQERRLVELYKQAVDVNDTDPEVWDILALTFLWNKDHIEKSLDALQRYETLAKSQNPEELNAYGHCINAWRGQTLDLLGRREEATNSYQQALHEYEGGNGYCSNIDEKWLEEHIRTPFALDERF